ncbi:unnamed protein product [Meloidogyne enterolobii]|uniref:Uncharacterized protein n=1 Tax=Meloidogyne enterolobii TaxID=390850 RepID=A0ACB0ZAU0_MELEN
MLKKFGKIFVNSGFAQVPNLSLAPKMSRRLNNPFAPRARAKNVPAPKRPHSLFPCGLPKKDCEYMGQSTRHKIIFPLVHMKFFLVYSSFVT